MPDFVLTCPDCGGAISHVCGANVAQSGANPVAQSGANVAQISAQSGATSEIAHVSDLALEVGSTPTTKSYNKGYDPHFLVFWAAYPLKRDKRKAQNAWRKAVRRLGANLGANLGEAMAQICAGAIRYRDDPNRVDQFTKYAEGWLNGDGWEDEPLPARNNGHKPSRQAKAIERLRGES